MTGFGAGRRARCIARRAVQRGERFDVLAITNAAGAMSPYKGDGLCKAQIRVRRGCSRSVRALRAYSMR